MTATADGIAGAGESGGGGGGGDDADGSQQQAVAPVQANVGDGSGRYSTDRSPSGGDSAGPSTNTTTTTGLPSPPACPQSTAVVAAAATVAAAAGSAGAELDDESTESTYHLKWIQWNSGKIPIVMQSRNGPCPLIATMNVLLLREKVKLPGMLEQVTATQLLTYLGECIMDCMPDDIQNDENAVLNLEQNLHDAMEILPKLKTGLDVNIRFTGITDFEYTPECIIFDLLRIPLYHGWLSDPTLIELQNAIGNQSYNQLVDNIITNKTSTDPDIQARVLISEEFLERTASQLTLPGLYELKSKIKDNEIGILFRNNHFLTLFKREGEIYTLVTDHGYLTEDNIIWETLDNIEGAGRFFDSNFQVSEVTNRQVSEFNAIDQRQQQLENDFLVALSLKEEETLAQGCSGSGSSASKEGATLANTLGTRSASAAPGATSGAIEEADFELAKRLQAEEDRIYDEMLHARSLPEGVRRQGQEPALDNLAQNVDRHCEAYKYKMTRRQLDPRPGSSPLTPEDFPPLSRVTADLPRPASPLSPPRHYQTSEHPAARQAVAERSPSDQQVVSNFVPSTSSYSATAVPNSPSLPLSASHVADSQNDPSQPQQQQQPHQQQPLSQRTSSSSSSNRRLKSEKNSKESNCIVN